ncbi:hypothetical protein D3C84_1217940 [compost metagenome]
MNGKVVDAQGIAVKNGVTTVDAAFVREHLQADYKDTGSVGLRAAAEAVGAKVEVLGAVGELRSAILIYTK